MSPINQIKVRIRTAGLLLLLSALALAGRLFYVQIIRHDELLAKAKRKYTASYSFSGKRGEILTSDGALLSGNVPCVNVTVDPSLLSTRQRRKLSLVMARLLKEAPGPIYRRLAPEKTVRAKDGTMAKKPVRYAVLARDLSLSQGSLLKNAVRILKIHGIYFEDTYTRVHPHGRMLANLLGLVNISEDRAIAISGLERRFDKELSGTVEKTIYERARDGRPISTESLDDTAKNGHNLYLTIVEPIQAIMEEELDRAYDEYQPKAVYAVMVDPYTGNVLAISQRPNFDPGNRASIVPGADRPRLVADTFEPGSILKPFTYAYALDIGKVTPQTKIDCETGRWVYLGKAVTDTHSKGLITIHDAIRTSSNIAAAKLGLELGKESVYNNLYAYGFGQKTGLQISPESRGIFRQPSQWDGLTVTRVPFGYAISVTAAQMARAYCTLANGGKRVDLNIIDRIVEPQTGAVFRPRRPEPVQIIQNPQTLQDLIPMLVSVTGKDGTAPQAAINGYQVAGKTGTSNKRGPGGTYTRKTMASFVGFAPANRPKFVLLVTVDEPSTGKRFGGGVSGPVFRRIGERTLKYWNIPPDPPAPEESEKR